MSTKEKKQEYRRRWREKNRDREKVAAAAYQRRRRAEDPDKHRRQLREWHRSNPSKRRDYELRANYGMTLQQYDTMLEEQGGVCAVCRQPESSVNQRGQVKPLAVDHCHSTGRIRGLLCSGCNVSIGHAKDNPETLRNLANYLEANTNVFQGGT